MLPKERSPEMKLALLAATILTNKWIPHQPHKKQAEFLMLECREALFGGAAGGGKSDALLMGALQHVETPGYNALLLRRTFPELIQASGLMTRAHEWLGGTAAQWKEQVKTWVFPSGATLAFGHMQYEKDKYNYQGGEYQYIGCDEVTHFSQSQYRYLFSRLRKLRDSDIPLRVRATANPDGIGMEWVKERFAIGLDENVKRAFVPSKLQDNPSLDVEEYIMSLGELDPVTRKRLLDGDWTVREKGPLFDRGWFSILDVEPACTKVVRYWDIAATKPKEGRDPDWAVGTKMGRLENGTFVVLHVVRKRGTPQELEQIIRNTAKLDGRECPVWIEEQPGCGSVITDHYVRSLVGYTVRGHRVRLDKQARAMPVSSQAEAGNIALVRGAWTSAWLDEIEAFPYGAHDDQVDSLSGAFDRLIAKKEIPAIGGIMVSGREAFRIG